jgi:hypothetical protein
MRKNIFELLSENFDVAYEIQTIWRLFTKEATFVTSNILKSFEYLMIDVVNTHSFTNWKSRNRCVSPLDMMNRLGINDQFVNNLDSFSDKTLLFLEFIVNMLARCEVLIDGLHLTVNKIIKYWKKRCNSYRIFWI